MESWGAFFYALLQHGSSHLLGTSALHAAINVKIMVNIET